ncbi:MAG TPA: response regulator [Ktedonobacterales bacterium]
MAKTGAGAQVYPVLIVEDDADLLETVATALRDYGYAVTVAASLADGLVEVERHTYRLVLCDLFATSPRDPLRSVQELRERAQPTPVGVMTSWKVTAEAAADRGFAFLLPKPFELDDFFARVAQAVQPALSPEHEREAALARGYFDALAKRDWEALAALCTDDVEFGPLGAATLVHSLHGRTALVEYLAEALSSFPGACFDELAAYITPRGLSVRYTAAWPATDGTAQRRQTGAVVFGFEGGAIARIAVRINEEHLRSITRSRPLKPR